MSSSVATERSPQQDDLEARNVAWDLDPLLDGAPSADDLLDIADAMADEMSELRGSVGTLGVEELGKTIERLARMNELVSRAGHFAMLRFSENTLDPAAGALMQAVTERSTAIGTKLIFFDLEWAAADDAHVDEVLADDRFATSRHYLRNLRRNRPHLLSEEAETILSEKSVSGASAWNRLFSEEMSSLTVEMPNEAGESQTLPFEAGLSALGDADRSKRAAAQQAVTDALQPGLRTRSFIVNTLLFDKSVDDRFRSFPTWVSSRNLENEASDESVDALVEAVVGRYDIPQRWYKVKAEALGLERLADYDRMATVADSTAKIGWEEARSIVQTAYRSFSPELADVTELFFENDWIDAPTREGKRGGAFCAYTVPQHHPYVFLNWTGEHRDVLTLAHELGHAAHAYLAREQGIFHQSTPLTLAETASVFGETVTNKQLLSTLESPEARFALLAATMDDTVATVFRQVAMNRFEHGIHTARREEGELSTERFGDIWAKSQTDMMGDSVEITDNYRSWWSYVGHFVAVPGYVYAYAYGQLLALSVYAQYEQRGQEFVPLYLDMLKAGGSRPPEELGKMVDCDLTDPGFWDAGLDIVERQLEAAIEAAQASGRIAAP